MGGEGSHSEETHYAGRRKLQINIINILRQMRKYITSMKHEWNAIEERKQNFKSFWKIITS